MIPDFIWLTLVFALFLQEIRQIIRENSRGQLKESACLLPLMSALSSCMTNYTVSDLHTSPYVTAYYPVTEFQIMENTTDSVPAQLSAAENCFELGWIIRSPLAHFMTLI